MTHVIYNTEGIILDSYENGETSRTFLIFTARFGLIYARAQGVREIKSKLRYALQDLSYVYVSLVYGRGGWRITSAEYISTFYPTSLDVDMQEVLSNARMLLRRLLKGEEDSQDLFEIVRSGFAYALSLSGKKEDIRTLEIVLMARVLNNLGYFAPSNELEEIINGKGWTKNTLAYANKKRSLIVPMINTAIRESHL